VGEHVDASTLDGFKQTIQLIDLIGIGISAFVRKLNPDLRLSGVSLTAFAHKDAGKALFLSVCLSIPTSPCRCDSGGFIRIEAR
jgi:hypothetical protein